MVCIELTDSTENFFDRLVFNDENDVIYKDDEYKNRHREHYLKEIQTDLNWYGLVYSEITNKFNISGMPPEKATAEMMGQFHLCKNMGNKS